MKINGLTLRASLLAALLATAPSAFAFGGLFDGGLFKSAEPEYVVDDGSFFAGEALTIGEMAAPSPFFASAAATTVPSSVKSPSFSVLLKSVILFAELL